ncbi:MAG: carotenoid oxygenase family protein, partial [Mycobacterium sp.]
MTPRGRGTDRNRESLDHEYARWDAAYVLGSLSADDRQQFEVHLDGCPSCREAVAELADLPTLLSLLDRNEVAAIDARDDFPAAPALLDTARLPGPSELAASAQRQRSSRPEINAVPAQTVFPLFRTGNYAPVPDELTAFDLPVDGSIPSELNGWYLRNGPNPRVAKGHWCIGDGMVHGLRLENGHAAWYRNRWVRTESFEQPSQVYNADGTRNLHSSVANTHVVRHAGKTLALMETSLPYEITNDLETLGA